jgi:hypothetical protein
MAMLYIEVTFEFNSYLYMFKKKTQLKRSQYWQNNLHIKTVVLMVEIKRRDKISKVIWPGSGRGRTPV